MALANRRLDLFLQNLTCQKTRDLRVVLQKLELHVNRFIEQVLQRFGRWRLFGVSPMLIFPRERGTFPNQSGKIRGRSDGRRDP